MRHPIEEPLLTQVIECIESQGSFPGDFIDITDGLASWERRPLSDPELAKWLPTSGIKRNLLEEDYRAINKSL